MDCECALEYPVGHSRGSETQVNEKKQGNADSQEVFHFGREDFGLVSGIFT